MARNIDNDSIIDKIKSLKDYREEEIQNLSDEHINKNNKVLDVKYLGTIEMDGEEKDTFLIIEAQIVDGEITKEMEKYYTSDGKALGVNVKDDDHDLAVLRRKFK